MGALRLPVVYPTPSPHRAPPLHRHLRLAESPPAKPGAGARRPHRLERAVPAGGAAAARWVPHREEAARQADRLAVSLRWALDLASAPHARAAATFVEKEVWIQFGYARIEDHARERFGRSGRWVRDLAALGRFFSTHPGLEAAVCGTDGGAPIGRVAGLLIGRIASAESLREWVALARSLSVRELREVVAAAREAESEWPPGFGDSCSARVASGHVAAGDDDAGEVAGQHAAEGDADACDVAGGRGEAGNAGNASRDGIEAGDADVGKIVAGTPAADDHDDDDASRSLVRLELPSPALAAFDEAVDLFRALEGHDASVTAFVEALVAEAACSSPPPESFDGAYHEGLTRGETIALRESALAHSTNTWEHLPEHGGAAQEGPECVLRLACFTLERLHAISTEAGRGTPSDLDAQIRELATLEDEIERRLAALLAKMGDDGAWERLRFDSAVHYAEQRLGLGRTATRMRMRVVRALKRLPETRRAYEAGVVGTEAAWLVSKMIGPLGVDRQAEVEWIDRARLATVKRLREEARLALRRAAGLMAGTDDVESCGESRGSSDGLLGFAAAVTEGQSAPGARDGNGGLRPVTDAEWHASLRRVVGTARGRIARLGRMAASRRVSDVFLRLRLPTDLCLEFLGAIEGARRRLEQQAGEIPWEEPWPDPDPPGSILAAREFFVRCRRTPAWVGLLALLEDFVETWDVDHARSRRAGQAIHERSGWRCSAPGCTSRKNLENHHVVYSGRGGSDEHWNRLSLCRFHHQCGEHGELARVRGRAPLGLLWRLGRAGCGGSYRNEKKVARRAPGAATRGDGDTVTSSATHPTLEAATTRGSTAGACDSVATRQAAEAASAAVISTAILSAHAFRRAGQGT